MYHDQPREWWVDAPSWSQASVLVRQRGLHVESVEEADPASRPLQAVLLRWVPEASARPESAWQRRGRRVAIGSGILLVMVLGIWFTLRAREHLGRGRPPIQQVP